MCPMCGNNGYKLLGFLGNVTHCRCIACGWDFQLGPLEPFDTDSDAPYWAQKD